MGKGFDCIVDRLGRRAGEMDNTAFICQSYLIIVGQGAVIRTLICFPSKTTKRASPLSKGRWHFGVCVCVCVCARVRACTRICACRSSHMHSVSHHVFCLFISECLKILWVRHRLSFWMLDNCRVLMKSNANYIHSFNDNLLSNFFFLFFFKASSLVLHSLS